jgi:hypothetical protein
LLLSLVVMDAKGAIGGGVLAGVGVMTGGGVLTGGVGQLQKVRMSCVIVSFMSIVLYVSCVPFYPLCRLTLLCRS